MVPGVGFVFPFDPNVSLDYLGGLFAVFITLQVENTIVGLLNGYAKLSRTKTYFLDLAERLSPTSGYLDCWKGFQHG